MKVNSLFQLTRRDFLKLVALGMGSLTFRPWARFQAPPAFPAGDLLGRVTVGKVDVKAAPDVDSQTVSALYEDAVVPWLKEWVGKNPNRSNQRWVETPEGYIWSPYLQPVRNLPNSPLTSLPETNLGPGLWVEVSIPYIDLTLDKPAALSPGFKHRLNLGIPPRLYYSQIMWVDQTRTDDQGQVWYRVIEKYGSYGDVLWGAAEAFRPLTTEEITPISSEVGNKRVVVDINHQNLSCYEGQTEVYFARISSGALFNSEGGKVSVWATPIGSFTIWRKLISLHMSGGTTGGGWDLPGIGWTSLFVGSGVAIHSTFWHNNFGEPMSRGCVNARPEDAKWVFRWTQPIVPYDPGDVTVSWPGGTTIEVKET